MKSTMERLMDVAESYIRRVGYHGFSFRDLASEVGISSAAVHHHFRTKAEMAAAVARRYGTRFLRSVERRPGERADDAVAAYRDAFRSLLERDASMCLYGALGAQAGALAPEVTSEMVAFFDQCINDLSERIGGPDARERAFQLLATFEGGMMLAHAHGSVDAYDRAVAGLLPLRFGRTQGRRPSPPTSTPSLKPDASHDMYAHLSIGSNRGAVA